MPDLPPQSRITSKIEGDELVLTIPHPAPASRGCLSGSWGATAAFAFLAITFIAQGLFSKQTSWSIAGLFCAAIAILQLPTLRAIRSRNAALTILRIAPGHITRITGPAQTPIRTEWQRPAISKLSVSPPNLHLHSQFAPSSPVCLLSTPDPTELAWIAHQIRLKWKMNPDGTAH
jgi:hypothetical protein